MKLKRTKDFVKINEKITSVDIDKVRDEFDLEEVKYVMANYASLGEDSLDEEGEDYLSYELHDTLFINAMVEIRKDRTIVYSSIYEPFMIKADSYINMVCTMTDFEQYHEDEGYKYDNEDYDDEEE